MDADQYNKLCQIVPGLLEYVAMTTGRAMIDSVRLGLRMGGVDDLYSDEDIMGELSSMMKAIKGRVQ